MSLRLSLLPAVLLALGAASALAESPMPDPVAPAVVGRPLDQWITRYLGNQKAAAAKPAKPQKPGRAAPKPATATMGAAHAASSKAVGAAEAPAHRAKQALDDRTDPNMVVDDVGKGAHFARKPLGPGVYFGDRHRTAVRKYYATHPLAEAPVKWQIGEPVPRGVQVEPVPSALLASLPKLPPGHRYVELGGEVVLVAAGSNMVVDGISRGARP